MLFSFNVYDFVVWFSLCNAFRCIPVRVIIVGTGQVLQSENRLWCFCFLFILIKLVYWLPIFQHFLCSQTAVLFVFLLIICWVSRFPSCNVFFTQTAVLIAFSICSYLIGFSVFLSQRFLYSDCDASMLYLCINLFFCPSFCSALCTLRLR